MDLKNKNIFVSGGAGVIGRPLVALLVEAGANVLVGDIKARPKEFSSSVGYRRGDLNYITREELEVFNPHYFFHLAATFERSAETYEFYGENFHHNVRLSHHLMDMLKDVKSLESVVFASSYLIYDPSLYLSEKARDLPVVLDEGSVIRPRNLTGSAKLSHEVELEFFRQFLSERVRFVSARIFRSFGRGSRDVISRWVRAAIAGEEIYVYNKDNQFDYIFADDVARGLMELGMSVKASGVYNLGSGKAHRVSDVVDILKNTFGDLGVKEVANTPPYEASKASMVEFVAVTGYTPSTSLETAIGEIVAYERGGGVSEGSKAGNVLITSVSKKVPLIQAVREAARKLAPGLQVYGADMDSGCLGAHFVDGFWEMPPLDEMTAEAFIDYAKAHDIRFVIPTRDGELRYFAKRAERFRDAGISVMVSSEQAVGMCLDKVTFYKRLSLARLPAITTATSLDISAKSYVVKEAEGAGSRSIGMDLSKQDAESHAKMLSKPLFQPYIEGRELSADAYVTRLGTVKGVVLRWREVVVDGESQVTSTFTNQKFEDQVRQVASTLGVYGHVVIQAIVDSENELHFVEANSRFGGASTLGVASGLDSFYWFFLESMGESLDDYPFLPILNKKLVRYAKDKIV